MMKKFTNGLSITLIAIVLFDYTSVSAGGGNTAVGSRQAGMGRSSVALTDLWSIHNNQAGIALLEKYSVGIFYENRFFIQQLGQKNLAFVAPTQIGVLGLSFNHFGYELYSDIKLGLAYARAFSPYFRMGIQLDYLLTSFGDNYGSKSSITFELGIQSDISNKVTIGAWIYNPLQISLNNSNNHENPIVFRLGASWIVKEGFIALLEVEKNSLISPIIIRGGLEYTIKNKFFLRSGFTTYREIFSIGFGIQLKLLKFDISAVMHQSLGFSPQSSLIFQF